MEFLLVYIKSFDLLPMLAAGAEDANAAGAQARVSKVGSI